MGVKIKILGVRPKKILHPDSGDKNELSGSNLGVGFLGVKLQCKANYGWGVGFLMILQIKIYFKILFENFHIIVAC